MLSDEFCERRWTRARAGRVQSSAQNGKDEDATTGETHVSQEVETLLSDEFSRQRGHNDEKGGEAVFWVGDGELRRRRRRRVSELSRDGRGEAVDEPRSSLRNRS